MHMQYIQNLTTFHVNVDVSNDHRHVTNNLDDHNISYITPLTKLPKQNIIAVIVNI